MGSLEQKTDINTLRLVRGNLLLLALFVTVYFILSRVNESAFTKKLSFIDVLYFATVTQSTVGYGDISPASPGMKLLVLLHIVASLFLNVCELIDGTAASPLLGVVYDEGRMSISLFVLLVCSVVAAVLDGIDFPIGVVIVVISILLTFTFLLQQHKEGGALKVTS